MSEKINEKHREILEMYKFYAQMVLPSLTHAYIVCVSNVNRGDGWFPLDEVNIDKLCRNQEMEGHFVSFINIPPTNIDELILQLG